MGVGIKGKLAYIKNVRQQLNDGIIPKVQLGRLILSGLNIGLDICGIAQLYPKTYSILTMLLGPAMDLTTVLVIICILKRLRANKIELKKDRKVAEENTITDTEENPSGDG